MEYNLDSIVNRKNTNCEKWDNLQNNFPKLKNDSLPLWVADMDFACAKPIQDALHERVNQQIYGYTQNMEDYHKTVCDWFKNRFDWEIDEKHIFFSPGVVPAIHYLLHILSDENEGIIIQEPVYYPFKRGIHRWNRKVVNNELILKNGKYEMDFEDLEEKMKDKNNVGMILCSPHNPVGRVWKEEELNKIVNLAIKYDKWIISDEIHSDIVRKDQKHIPLLKLRPDAKNRIIACTSPSKSFNLAGIQISNIVIPNEKYQQLWKDEIMSKLCISTPNIFAQSAVIAAYSQSEDWLNQVNAYIDDNIAYVKEVINRYLPKALVIDCEGTYLMWIDFRAYESDYEKLEDRMQSEAGVLFDEGYIFGEKGIGFERINCACPRSILQEALQRMIKVFGQQEG